MNCVTTFKAGIWAAFWAAAIFASADMAYAETNAPTSLMQGRPTTVPLGYLDFCNRHALECEADAPVALVASGVADQDRPAAFKESAHPDFDWAAVFGTSLPAGKLASLDANTSFPALTQPRWQTLEDMNRMVNVTVRPVS